MPLKYLNRNNNSSVISAGNSVLFNGSNQYLSIPGNAAFNFGTGNFTIEWWQYMTSQPSNPRVFSIGNYPSTTIGVSIEGSGTFYLWENSSVGFSYSLTADGYLNRWLHFAISRNNGNTSIFKNGIQIGSSYSDTNNINNTSTALSIGQESSATAASYFPGYISNLRILNGTALYTSNFTPSTTPLSAIANTSLLACQSATIIDNSTNNFTVTNNNGATVSSAVTPFTAVLAAPSGVRFLNRSNVPTVLPGTQKAIFGYGRRTVNYSVTNLVSDTGVVATDTTGVGTARYSLAAAGYGTDKAIFGYGYTSFNVSLTNLVSNTGVVSTDTSGVGTARSGLAAAGYGSDKAIFGYGYTSANVSMTNLVSNTGVVATDTSGVGTARHVLAAAGYGSDKAIFGYGSGPGGYPEYFVSMTNLVSNTGVVATDTTGVGTKRQYSAAAGYGSDKAIFGYGITQGGYVSITNKVNNSGVVAIDTAGVGETRYYLAAAGYSITTIPATSNFKVKKLFADPTIVTSGLVLNLDASNASSYAGSGTSWFDLSGNNNNGTLTNGPTFNSANGGSIVFDGSDDYVNLGNAPSIKMGTGDFTISTWVKILTQTGTATFKGIISSKQAGAASAGYGFYWNNSVNKFLWSTGNGSSSSEIFTTNAWSSLVNVWANIVMIRQNGATNNGHFYINGVYEPLASAATVLNVDTTTNMTLGNVADFYSPYWFTGTYGATQIYNRALTASELLQNYNVTKTRFGL
jgi:hypothetical protein